MLLLYWLIISFGNPISGSFRNGGDFSRRRSCVASPEGFKYVASCPGPQCQNRNCTRRHRRCVCDDQCGFVCINPEITCTIENNDGLPNGSVHPDRIMTFNFDERITYKCVAGYNLVGNEQRRCQGNKKFSGTGPVCIDQRINCGPPPNIANARFEPVKKYYQEDIKVKYACNPGFRLPYGHYQRTLSYATCRKSNDRKLKWYGPNMECIRKDCPDLSAPENGRVQSGDNTNGKTIRFQCDKGHKLVGDSLLRCNIETESWDYHPPKCEPVICNRPTNINNGIVTSVGAQSNTVYGSSIRYKCNDGFHMSGRSEMTCGADGSWEGVVPMCTEYTCSNPGNEYITYVGEWKERYSIRYKLVARCSHPNRTLVPENGTTVCTTSGWHPKPSEFQCVAIKCKQLSVYGDLRPNGLINTSELRNLVGDTVWYECANSMDTIENSVRYTQCVDPGVWSRKLPKCFASCTVKQVDGRHVEGLSSDNRARHLRVLAFSCTNIHMELSLHENTTFVCNNGAILPAEPTCEYKSCKEWPASIDHGIVLFVKKSHLSRAKYVCNPGYRMMPTGPDPSPTPYVTCTYGQWMGPTHECVAVKCGNVFKTFRKGLLANGKVKIESALGTYDYTKNVSESEEGRRILFECDKFFTRMVLCEYPELMLREGLENGVVEIEGGLGSYRYDRKVVNTPEMKNIIFKCNDGFILRGPPKATCVQGEWLPKFKVTCVAQKHPQLDDYIDWGKEFRYQKQRREKRSTIRQQDIRIRFYNHLLREHAVKFRDLDETALKGLRVYIPELIVINETVINSLPQTLAELEQSLDSNYSKQSDDEDRVRRSKPISKIHQSDSENWQNEQIYEANFCLPLRDTSVMRVQYRQLAMFPNGSVPVGAQVNVSCGDDHRTHLVPPENSLLICQRGGVWYPEVPRCAARDCRVPLIAEGFFMVHHGQVIPADGVNTIPHDSGAMLYCNQNYTTRGNTNVECNYGAFIKVPGTCIEKPCRLPVIKFGAYRRIKQHSRRYVSHKTRVKFTCYAGNRPMPPSKRVVCNYGKLIPRVPKCVDKRSLRNIDNKPKRFPRQNGECEKPVDTHKAWVYKESQFDEGDTRKIAVEFDRIEALPNNTLVHYKCGKDAFPRQTQRHVATPNAIICIHGEWKTLLKDCAHPNLPPYSTTLETSALANYCEGPTFNKYDDVVITNEVSFMSINKKNFYSPGTQLKLFCVANEKLTWTIECVGGKRWKNEQKVDCNIRPSKDCHFTKGQHLHVFDNKAGEYLDSYPRRLSDGTKLDFRCEHVGIFRLDGPSTLKCTKGRLGIPPRCVSRFNGSADRIGAEPPVLYTTYPAVDLAVTKTGEIIVNVGTDLILHCLVPEITTAKWNVEVRGLNYRPYTGKWLWSESDKKRLELRTSERRYNVSTLDRKVLELRIDGIRKNESGQYRCDPVRGATTTLTIRATNVKCPLKDINPAPGSKLNRIFVTTDKTRLNSIAKFKCDEGFSLVGATTLVCMENGQWSKRHPTCSPVLCPSLGAKLSHPYLEYRVNGYRYGNSVEFGCSYGYRISSGPKVIHCNRQGHWSDRVPQCKAIECIPPKLPKYTKLDAKKETYTVGDNITFACTVNSSMTFGNLWATCQQSKQNRGVWSNRPTECKPVCTLPGRRRVLLKLNSRQRSYYEVNDYISFYCLREDKWRLDGPSVMYCTEGGRWNPPKMPWCRQKNRRRHHRKKHKNGKLKLN